MKFRTITSKLTVKEQEAFNWLKSLTHKHIERIFNYLLDSNLTFKEIEDNLSIDYVVIVYELREELEPLKYKKSL